MVVWHCFFIHGWLL